MINIKEVVKKPMLKISGEKLTRSNWREDKCAFIGSIGDYSGVFFVTYAGITYLKKPSATWDWDVEDVYVDRFVDLDVVVRERQT